VQAANDTNSYEDRESIQLEIDELTQEVDRISSDTEYNTKTLLDGSSGTRVYTEPKAASRMDVSSDVVAGTYQLAITEAGKQAELTVNIPDSFDDGVVRINDVKLTVTAGMSKEDFFESLRNTASEAGCSVEWNENQTSVKISTTRYGTNAEIDYSVSESLATALGAVGQGAKWNSETQTYDLTKHGEDAVVSIPSDRENAGFSTTATVRADGNRIKVTDLNGFSIDFLLDSNYEMAEGTDLDVAATNGNFAIEVTDIGPMTIQIGANQYQTMELNIPELSAETLYLDTVDVTVAGGADRAITTLDEAIAKLSSVRSDIGAFQNRLEYAQKSLAETQEDMTAAYSALLDVDMAEEMSEYTQQNVLDQAAISVLSQANDLPQQVLSLLQ
jgi:flagellin